MKVTLLTGDAPHYELGLLSGLIRQGLEVDVIGGDCLGNAPVLGENGVHLLPYRRSFLPGESFHSKLRKVLGYYLRLIAYAFRSESRLFHIQWPYKFVFLDNVVLPLFYKLLGKKLVFTAHNVDSGVRDGTSSWLNRWSLRALYRRVDHIIVHTARMKSELMSWFNIPAEKISVVPHGINSVVPDTALTRMDARDWLGLGQDERAVLFFGNIDRYKGLDMLVEALTQLRMSGTKMRLVIAGRVKECPDYWQRIKGQIDTGLEASAISHLGFIPDELVERYFKAADVLVMPYRSIFQSGVLFMALRFGLPVIATDVGAFKEDIVEGKNGLICRPEDPAALARAVETYFRSDLFHNLPAHRGSIQAAAEERYSWTEIGAKTNQIYEGLLCRDLPGRGSVPC
jgi:glycosyltransferase involved in cell wall biosynthesis